MHLRYSKNLIKIVQTFILILINISCINMLDVQAFPIYAQQGYEDPREATGRIVCANCHLAQKPVNIEVPQAVLPNSIFEATIKIPYESKNKQILSNGNQGPLNTGAILILPEGFKLAPKDLMTKELQEKTKNVYIQPYSTIKDNILIAGPIYGKTNQEIIFPILSPDPSKDKNTHFLKYPIYVGGNRGRGQIYPAGDKSNNNIISSLNSGKVIDIIANEKGGYIINIQKTDKSIYEENIPAGLTLNIKKGDNILAKQNITNDPNVGGFGQNETEIVLQSPTRIKGMIIFFFSVTLAQILLVLKKKQWEKVQAAEINF